jgi:hypothetical protein
MKAEHDYLVSRDKVNHDYYCVKSRLQKKLQQFTMEELPLLIEKGYIDIAEFGKLAENCKIPENQVAQPAERRFVLENDNNETKSPRWDLNPRPKVSAPQIAGLRNLRSAS